MAGLLLLIGYEVGVLGVFARRIFAALQMSTRFGAHWEGWRALSHLGWYLFMSPATMSTRAKISWKRASSECVGWSRVLQF